MKTFVRTKSEALVIDGEVVVTVVDILDEEIVLAIDTPQWVQVCPKEASERAEILPAQPR
jgi:sRNA-binding carbon storage regulator CsrA